MKLKPLKDRGASVRRMECIVDGCTKTISVFGGFCQEHRAELNESLRLLPNWRQSQKHQREN